MASSLFSIRLILGHRAGAAGAVFGLKLWHSFGLVPQLASEIIALHGRVCYFPGKEYYHLV
jgi:hypothetical protein